MIFIIALILAVIAIEVLIGKKRGGCLESFRLFTVLIASVLAVSGAVFSVKTFVKPIYIPILNRSVLTEYIPLIEDLAFYFVMPVISLLLYVFFKLLLLIAYEIVSDRLKSGKHSTACEPSKSSLIKGIATGAAVGLISAMFVAFPIIRIGNLYSDYKNNKKNIETLFSVSKGEDVSMQDKLDALYALSDYILDMPYASEKSKVQALNYSIKLINDMLAKVDNKAVSKISLGTYDNMEDHKKQVEAVVGIVKTFDDAGLLSDEGIKPEKVLDAVTDISTATSFVDSVSKLDNGGEMLVDVINEMVNDMSNGEIKTIINESAVSELDKNRELIINTLAKAECFKDMSKESYTKMTPDEKHELIKSINEVKQYGMLDSAVCEDLIRRIEASMSD